MRVAVVSLLLLAVGQPAAGFFVPSLVQTPSKSKSKSKCESIDPRQHVFRAISLVEGEEVTSEPKANGSAVIVKIKKAKQETESGIFIPGKEKERQNLGEVVICGEGRTHWDTGLAYPMMVKPGDQVALQHSAGMDSVIDGEEHRIVTDSDVLFTYTGDNGPTLDTLEPVGDRIIVKIERNMSNELASGVLLAETALREFKETTGEVVKVGPGKAAPNGKMMPMHCEPGDHIKFRDFSFEFVDIQGLDIGDEEFLVIRNTDVMAKW